MTKLEILIPLDTTPFSRAILGQIERLFPPATTTLTLLHVRKPEALSEFKLQGASPRYGYEYSQVVTSSHSFDKDGLDVLDRRLMAQLERDAALLREKGYAVTTVLRQGEPAEEIIALAEDSVDAIAMATHGHTGIAQLFFGSTAQTIFARVNIPIMLLRAGDDSPP